MSLASEAAPVKWSIQKLATTRYFQRFFLSSAWKWKSFAVRNQRVLYPVSFSCKNLNQQPNDGGQMDGVHILPLQRLPQLDRSLDQRSQHHLPKGAKSSAMPHWHISILDGSTEGDNSSPGSVAEPQGVRGVPSHTRRRLSPTDRWQRQHPLALRCPWWTCWGDSASDRRWGWLGGGQQ